MARRDEKTEKSILTVQKDCCCGEGGVGLREATLVLLALCVLWLPLFLEAGACSDSISWGTPSIFIPATAPGEIRDVSFVLTNPLSAPISITNATASCGCIGVRATYGAILPGATGTVSASVRAGAAEGPFVNRIYVLFDNGEYSKLDIRGEVKAFLKVTPPSLEIHDMVPGEVQEVSFEITVADNADMEILRTRIDGGDIELKGFESERKGSTIDCLVGVVPRVAARRLVGTLILETSHPNQRELQIPIVFYPKIPLEIQPSSAFLGASVPTATPTPTTCPTYNPRLSVYEPGGNHFFDTDGPYFRYNVPQTLTFEIYVQGGCSFYECANDGSSWNMGGGTLDDHGENWAYGTFSSIGKYTVTGTADGFHDCPVPPSSRGPFSDSGSIYAALHWESTVAFRFRKRPVRFRAGTGRFRFRGRTNRPIQRGSRHSQRLARA